MQRDRPRLSELAQRAGGVRTLPELAALLRELRRRHARQHGGAGFTYRDLAPSTGWSHGIIGEYLSGRVLPPTGRFDTLIALLGASSAEQGAFATARDRVEENRRQASGPGARAAGYTGQPAAGAVPAVVAAGHGGVDWDQVTGDPGRANGRPTGRDGTQVPGLAGWCPASFRWTCAGLPAVPASSLTWTPCRIIRANGQRC